jgi:prolyl-tRNA editing enzyme YbaK/EbsC (Cys-tRNA(Pro) deacylase)
MDQISGHPSVLRVGRALADHGARGRIRLLDDAARTAAAAAGALGVTVGQIANSLIFVQVPGDGDRGPAQHGGGGRNAEPLLILTSGAHRVDTAKVAGLLGLAALDRADADLVRATTGFAIGGVAPVGHLTPVATLVDVALARYDVVWAAAGHPHSVFPTSYAELLRITGGAPVEVV